MRPVDVNYSDWDCTLEPDNKGFALRLGLRQVDGMRRDAGLRVMAARDAPFTDVGDVKGRARLDCGITQKLAAADAFRSCGIDRRAALWQAQGLRDAPALALFDHAAAAGEGAEPEVVLPAMAQAEHVVADYQTLRLSLKAHPMAFFRGSLKSQGFSSTHNLIHMGHGQRVSLAGLVLVRQKPGSAKGVCFITLEDEDGVANLVIWPKLFEHYRALIMTARLLVVHGRVQTDGRVIHVVADRLEDRTARLDTLSDERVRATYARGDEVLHPVPDQVGGRQHPRNMRVIPKSRDFH